MVWTLVAQIRVQPMADVEHRDVRDDVRPGLFAGLVAAPVDPLALQGAKKALDHRVIPAVPLAAHTACDSMSLEQLAEGLAGILHAPDALMFVKWRQLYGRSLWRRSASGIA